MVTNKAGGKMTVQEAGRLGGRATAETHDHTFYEQIGSVGGSKSGGNFKRDPKRARTAGHTGGIVRGRGRHADTGPELAKD